MKANHKHILIGVAAVAAAIAGWYWWSHRSGGPSETFPYTEQSGQGAAGVGPPPGTPGAAPGAPNGTAAIVGPNPIGGGTNPGGQVWDNSYTGPRPNPIGGGTNPGSLAGSH